MSFDVLLDRIEIQMIRLRLTEPFRISSGLTHDRRILIVRVAAGGSWGIGECTAGEAPNYSYETVETARAMLTTYLAPAVLGQRFESAAAVAPSLNAAAKGHPMAKAALEMAVWDLEARLRGVPLARLLGGDREAVATGVSIGIQPDVATLLDRIRRFRDEGYRRIKVKIAPGWDFEVLEAIRTTFPDLPLTVDANAAYAPGDLDRLTAIDGFGLLMLEQPFAEDDLLTHAELQARIRTPICLDESVTSPARCAVAMRLEAGRIVNIKPGRVGGHAASIQIHDLCADAGLPVWCGGMLESGIGRAHNVALASLPNFRLPGDTSASRRYWTRDVVLPAFELEADGTVRVPTGPGIGVELDEEYLRAIAEGPPTVLVAGG